jgi:hypothetical protein
MQDCVSTHHTPRWVKVTGIVVIALLLLFVGLHLIGTSFPGHVSGGGGGHAPPPGVTERGMQQLAP